MSINAPTSIAFTGDVAVTISVTWSSNPAGSTITVNSNTYPMLGVFDNSLKIVNDIQTAGSCSAQQAERILQALQFLVQGYDLQVSGALSGRMSIAVS